MGDTTNTAEAGNRQVSAEELATLAEIYAVSLSWLTGLGVETGKLQWPAVEMAKLDPEDADRLGELLEILDAPGRRRPGGRYRTRPPSTR